MSQQSPSRYALPISGMVGAMVMVLLVVGGFVAFRAVNRDNKPTPVSTVDYSGYVRSGRDDGKLAILAPAHTPDGWRATSAQYTTGVAPHWHLGVLTASGRYVGLEEGLAPASDQVDQYVDQNATRGTSLTIGGSTWQSWTDSGGDYALVQSRPARQKGATESVVVVGSAPPAQIRAYVETLSDTAR